MTGAKIKSPPRASGEPSRKGVTFGNINTFLDYVKSHAFRANITSPIANHEQRFLARMMMKGASLRHSEAFSDRRNQIIYWNLSYLQTVIFHPGIDDLLAYLEEFHQAEAAGGAAYIRGIFRSAAPQRLRLGN
jgi:hypothetical protein